MLFIETPIFTKEVRALLRDDEYRALQSAILLRPEQGAVIPGVFATLKLSHILPFDTRKLSHPGLSPRIVLEDVTSSARGGRKGCSTWWTWNTSPHSNSCNTGRSGRLAGDWGSRATPSQSICPRPIPRRGIIWGSLVQGRRWDPSEAPSDLG